MTKNVFPAMRKVFLLIKNVFPAMRKTFSVINNVPAISRNVFSVTENVRIITRVLVPFIAGTIHRAKKDTPATKEMFSAANLI
ncbi:MAG TPA: hypothetical protein VI757_13990 [Bacteroidia bacterium]|nr:hypothetical protein [Bacteroidia bacterium]